MNTKKPIIVGLGEILWDLLPDGKVWGGAPANFAYHCSQLGADSYVVSAIGNDDLGAEIRENVERLNLSTDYLFTDEKIPTSTVTVKLNAHGHPEYTIHEDVAWDNLPVVQEALDLVSGANAICFGSLAQRLPVSRKSIQSYLANTPEDCLRIFDINIRQHYYSKEVIKESLDVADVLKLNDDELVLLTDLFSLKGDEDAVLDTILRDFNLKWVALTRGSEGSTLYNGSERSDYKAEAVRAVDTVGAGDSFTAVMVMTYLKGMSLKDMNRLAADLAAFVCTQKGATPVIPSDLLSELQ